MRTKRAHYIQTTGRSPKRIGPFTSLTLARRALSAMNIGGSIITVETN